MVACLRGRSWPDEYLNAIHTTVEDYFRMGVSVMNLEIIRKSENFMENRENFMLHK